MSQQTALLCILIYIAWLFALEIRRRGSTSSTLWVVVLWAALIGSRPVASWFNVDSNVWSAAAAYDQGDPLERMVYSVLIVLGLVILAKRNVRIERVIRANKWLIVFFLYWGLSAFWADLPFLALKRWIKDVGNVVMVLVVLTEDDPMEATKAVFMRCGCLLIPLSVLLIKFYPEIGRTYHQWSGEMMFTGITIHKNSLGALLLVFGLFWIWDFVDRLGNRSKPRDWLGLLSDVSLMTMSLWLLVKANSATALVSFALGAAVFLALTRPAIKAKVRYLEFGAIIICLIAWMIEAMIHGTIFPPLDISQLAGALGRDPTLTTRTEVWPMLLDKSDSVLFGAGFNSFWSGERLEQLYSQLGIIQAHNGYLETYLNGGLVALLLLAVLLVSTIRNINRELMRGGDFASIRLAFLVAAIAYNFTEASINKMTLVWFALLLVLVRYPAARTIHNGHASSNRHSRRGPSFQPPTSPIGSRQP
jgi:exopolysaccharide production protein ExoQ